MHTVHTVTVHTVTVHSVTVYTVTVHTVTVHTVTVQTVTVHSVTVHTHTVHTVTVHTANTLPRVPYTQCSVVAGAMCSYEYSALGNTQPHSGILGLHSSKLYCALLH